MKCSCRGFLLSISALADGNPDAATPAVRTQLANCSECARVYREQRELSEWLRAGLPDAEPSPRIWMRIESRLEDPRRSYWGRLGSEVAAAIRLPEVRYVAAGLFLLAILSGGFMGRVQEAQPAPPVYAKTENPFLAEWQRQTFPASLAERTEAGENPFEVIRGER